MLSGLIGMRTDEAIAMLESAGKKVRCLYQRNDRQSRADTMLVVRARLLEADAVELVATPFILKPLEKSID